MLSLLLLSALFLGFEQPVCSITGDDAFASCEKNSGGSFEDAGVCGLDLSPSVPGGGFVGALLPLHEAFDPATRQCPRETFLGWDAVQLIHVSNPLRLAQKRNDSFVFF